MEAMPCKIKKYVNAENAEVNKETFKNFNYEEWQTHGMVDGEMGLRFFYCFILAMTVLLKYCAGIEKEIVMVQRKEHGCHTF